MHFVAEFLHGRFRCGLWSTGFHSISVNKVLVFTAFSLDTRTSFPCGTTRQENVSSGGSHMILDSHDSHDAGSNRVATEQEDNSAAQM